MFDVRFAEQRESLGARSCGRGRTCPPIFPFPRLLQELRNSRDHEESVLSDWCGSPVLRRGCFLVVVEKKIQRVVRRLAPLGNCGAKNDWVFGVFVSLQNGCHGLSIPVAVRIFGFPLVVTPAFFAPGPTTIQYPGQKTCCVVTNCRSLLELSFMCGLRNSLIVVMKMVRSKREACVCEMHSWPKS